MFNLALRSLKYRATSFAASFLSMFLGALIVMAFASMLDTSRGASVDATTEETLVTMATVAGGWCLLIVVFAVVSTLTLAVRQRGEEMALLKSVGATPAQIGRLIVGEAAIVAILAALAAILPAMLAGRIVFELLKDTDQVAPGVAYSFGPIAIGMGFGVTIVAGTIAAFVTARRVTGMRATEALLATSNNRSRMSRKRIAAGVVFLLAGLNCGVLTATIWEGQGSDAMMTGGQASIWFAIGLAILAPALVRAVAAVVALPLRAFGGPSGYMTLQNLRQRTGQMASAAMPIILFTAVTTGTIYMQSVENSALAAEGLSKSNEQRNIETLNFVVVGMIALFAAIMLVNTLIAATTYRRREFGQQRLAGATPPQVLSMVSMESLVLAATGILFGSIASLFTIIPYSIARNDSILPDATILIYIGVVTVAATIALSSSLGAARRAIRVPAVEAVG